MGATHQKTLGPNCRPRRGAVRQTPTGTTSLTLEVAPMKSKTFVMMFVAIGCGLVAAYLTARISAKQSVPQPVTVLVAKERSQPAM